METEVSKDVKKAAEKYADNIYPKKHGWGVSWDDTYNAFIAGAAFNKPYEHNEKLKIEDNGNSDNKNN